MSEAEEKEGGEEKAAGVPPPRKSGPGLLGVLLPAVLAAGGAFGGVKAAGGMAHAAAAEPAHATHEAKPPGPTVSLEPFILTVVDGAKKVHPLKVSIAVEFDHTTKEDALKPFVSRIRDATLSHLRTLSYEDSIDAEKSEKLRSDLLERYRSAGATGAERVLITDLVAQ